MKIRNSLTLMLKRQVNFSCGFLFKIRDIGFSSYHFNTSFFMSNIYSYFSSATGYYAYVHLIQICIISFSFYWTFYSVQMFIYHAKEVNKKNYYRILTYFFFFWIYFYDKIKKLFFLRQFLISLWCNEPMSIFKAPFFKIFYFFLVNWI